MQSKPTMESVRNTRSPLQQAVLARNKDLVLYLANKDSVNRVDSESGNTALHYAIQTGDMDIIKELLQHSTINVRLRNNEGKSPIDLAIQSGNIEIFERLLSNLGITLPTISINEQQEVLKKFANVSDDEIQSILSCYFCVWNLFQNENRNPKLAIVLENNLFSEKTLDFVLKIIQNKQHMDSYEIHMLGHYVHSKNPLVQAATEQKLEYVRLFANRGSIHTVDSESGNTALHYAVQTANMDIMNELLQYSNIDVRLKNKQGKSPIHLAIQSGNVEIFERLLSTLGIRLATCTTKEQNKALKKFEDDYEIQTVLRCYYALLNLHRHNNPKLTKNSDHTLFTNKETLDFALKIIQATQDVHNHHIDLLRYYAKQIGGYLAKLSIQDNALNADEKYRVWNNLFRISHNSPFSSHYKKEWQIHIRSEAFEDLKTSLGDKTLSTQDKIAKLQAAKKQPVFATHRSTCFFYRIGKTNTVKAIDKMIEEQKALAKRLI